MEKAKKGKKTAKPKKGTKGKKKGKNNGSMNFFSKIMLALLFISVITIAVFLIAANFKTDNTDKAKIEISLDSKKDLKKEKNSKNNNEEVKKENYAKALELFEKCIEYAVTSASYPKWATWDYYQEADLAAAHQAFAVGLVYNWLYDDLTQDVMATHRLIINASPVGMYPACDNAPNIPYAMLSGSHYLFDLVYNPLTTRFMELGAEQGAATLSGIDMLYAQAESAWRIWNRD